MLVVDDDVGLQETLEAVLSYEGYDVMRARDGVDALAQIAQRPPEVIVLDWAMPRMDGPSFVAALARQGLRPRIPILVLTADGRALQKAAQINAEACMAKPFDIDALLAEVARLLAA